MVAGLTFLSLTFLRGSHYTYQSQAAQKSVSEFNNKPKKNLLKHVNALHNCHINTKKKKRKKETG